MAIALPPNEVFEIDPGSYKEPNDLAGATSQSIVDTNLYCPPTGGMFVKLEGELLPRKGLCYPQAADANNVVKRLLLATLSLFRQFGIIGFILKRHKIKELEKTLNSFNRLATSVYRTVKPCPYLKYSYYCEFSRALWTLSYWFLTNLGISHYEAEQTAKNAATIMEYEDAYRFAVKDALAEIGLNDWLNRSQWAVNRLTEIVKQRATGFEVNKFLNLLKLFKLALYVPFIKKAFRKALQQTLYQDLQADANDRFWCLIRTDWLYGGLSVEKRKLQLTKEDYNPNNFVWRNINYMSEEQTQEIPVQETPVEATPAEVPTPETVPSTEEQPAATV